MGKITVVFKDPQGNIITVPNVDTEITISSLRAIFIQYGGDSSEQQWKINAKILDDKAKLSSYFPEGKTLSKIAISVVNAVRGGRKINKFNY